jgi:ketosteroid isomerase-like protein
MLAPMPTIEELATRLDRVESILALHRLSADYCRGADRRDLDLFLSVWTPTAVWAPRENVVYTGTDEIAEAIERQWRSVKRAFHWTSNGAIDVDGDAATARFDVDAELELLDGSWIAVAGEYQDAFVRTKGRWRMSKRLAVIHSQFALARAAH